MRTVHEPEPARQTANADSTPGQPKKGPKIRLVNGKGSSTAASAASTTAAGDGQPVLDPNDPNYDPSPANDNIQYIPARHPITGQPGFMITYPPDIHFSQFESEIPANQLVRLLRRQLHWAQDESDQLKLEVEELEKMQKEEWKKKEAALQGVMEAELNVGVQNVYIPDNLLQSMKDDLDALKPLQWSKEPKWKKAVKGKQRATMSETGFDGQMDIDRDMESEPPVQRDDEDAGSEDEDADDALEPANHDDANKMLASTESGHVASQERDAIDALMGMGNSASS